MNAVTAVDMSTIESSCARLAAARVKLDAALSALAKDIGHAKRRHLKSIRGRLARVCELHAATLEQVTAAETLFDDPKSIVLHGIKVGFAKSRPTVDIPDEDRTIDLRAREPDEFTTWSGVSVDGTPLRMSTSP